MVAAGGRALAHPARQAQAVTQTRWASVGEGAGRGPRVQRSHATQGHVPLARAAPPAAPRRGPSCARCPVGSVSMPVSRSRSFSVPYPWRERHRPRPRSARVPCIRSSGLPRAHGREPSSVSGTLAMHRGKPGPSRLSPRRSWRTSHCRPCGTARRC